MSFCKTCKTITKTDVDYTVRVIDCYIQVGRCLTCKKVKRNAFTREEMLRHANSEVRKLKKYTKPQS